MAILPDTRPLGVNLRRVLLTAVAALAAACGSDDETTGPDEDLFAYMTSGLPAGWTGGAAVLSGWDLGRDAGTRHGGLASAYVRSRLPNPDSGGFATLTQIIRADRYRNQRLRYSGFVRTLDVTGGGAALWLRADGPPGGMAFDNMATRRILGTRDWTRFEIVLDIPASAIGIAFGFFLSGTGIAWVDDLKMEIVGNDVGVTAGPSTLTPQDDSTQFNDKYDRLAKEGLNLDFEGLPTWPNDVAAIDWIRRNASGLVTDDPAAPLTDLAPLRDLVGSARMVALGEATHGTREFFRMKHRVFRYLVSTLRFTHFAIEASLPEALAVDRYVQTGIGDPDALVKGMYFWTWSTEEVVDLVRWMRSWNASGGTPGVRFVGFDMQFPGVAIDSVVSFTRRMDVADGNLVGSHYSCLASYRNTPTRLSARIAQYLALTQEVKDACRNALLAVEALLTARAGDWGPSAGIESVQLAQRLARVVSQWEAFARVTAPFDTYARDESMAENAAWWLETAPVGSRVMLWAHNGHVSRARRWMGEHLHRRLGGDYLPVALTFSQGTFNAMSPVGSLFAHTIPASEPNSLEALFGATGSSRLLLDTRRISHPGAPIGAIEHTLLRSIGAVFSQTASSTQYLTTVLLPDDFDIVIWFESATASRLLPFPLTGSSSR